MLKCYRILSVLLHQPEISAASSTSAWALFSSGLATGLTPFTWPGRVHSACAASLDLTPTMALCSVCSWARYAVICFSLRRRCLDEGNMVVLKNSEMPATAETQGVLWLSPSESWYLTPKGLLQLFFSHYPQCSKRRCMLQLTFNLAAHSATNEGVACGTQKLFLPIVGEWEGGLQCYSTFILAIWWALGFCPTIKKN